MTHPENNNDRNAVEDTIHTVYDKANEVVDKVKDSGVADKTQDAVNKVKDKVSSIGSDNNTDSDSQGSSGVSGAQTSTEESNSSQSATDIHNYDGRDYSPEDRLSKQKIDDFVTSVTEKMLREGNTGERPTVTNNTFQAPIASEVSNYTHYTLAQSHLTPVEGEPGHYLVYTEFVNISAGEPDATTMEYRTFVSSSMPATGEVTFAGNVSDDEAEELSAADLAQVSHMGIERHVGDIFIAFLANDDDHDKYGIEDKSYVAQREVMKKGFLELVKDSRAIIKQQNIDADAEENSLVYQILIDDSDVDFSKFPGVVLAQTDGSVDNPVEEFVQ